MSTATFTQAPVRPRSGPRQGHGLGDALRAVKVFAGAALGVVLLGEHSKYDEEAGVRRR